MISSYYSSHLKSAIKATLKGWLASSPLQELLELTTPQYLQVCCQRAHFCIGCRVQKDEGDSLLNTLDAFHRHLGVRTFQLKSAYKPIQPPNAVYYLLVVCQWCLSKPVWPLKEQVYDVQFRVLRLIL